MHRPTNPMTMPIPSFRPCSILSFLFALTDRQDGRGEEKEERKEVSKKEKKAGAVNDAMPKAPRLSFGSVLSVCKAKEQVERVAILVYNRIRYNAPTRIKYIQTFVHQI